MAEHREEIARFLQLIHRHPVAAATKSEDDIRAAIRSQVALIFLLRCDVFHISPFIAAAHERGKAIVVHLELAGGVSPDRAGVRWLRTIGVDGIITSRAPIIAAARSEGLVAIHRLLLIDDSSLDSGVRAVLNAHPDIVEILPGIIFPDIAPILRKLLPGPFIAGGFIRTAADVERVRRAGALLCSTSTHSLWGL
jgi:glycerol uptake operon antiterminator